MERDRTYDRQLMLLGACLASRELLDLVSARDFAEIELGAVFEELQQVARGKLEQADAFRVEKYFKESMGVERNGSTIAKSLHREVRLDSRHRQATSLIQRMQFELKSNDRTAAIEKLKKLAAEL